MENETRFIAAEKYLFDVIKEHQKKPTQIDFVDFRGSLLNEVFRSVTHVRDSYSDGSELDRVRGILETRSYNGFNTEIIQELEVLQSIFKD